MANEVHRFLDDYGTQEMFNIFLEISDLYFDEKVVKKIDDISDDKHMPSAAAVYKILRNILNGYDTPKESLDALKEYFEKIKLKVEKQEHLEIVQVTGKITSVADPDTRTLYLQRDNVFVKTWKMYVYSDTPIDGSNWVCVGDTTPDLVGYWKKDQISELKQFLGVDDDVEYVPLTSSYIKGRVNVIFNKHRPE